MARLRLSLFLCIPLFLLAACTELPTTSNSSKPLPIHASFTTQGVVGITDNGQAHNANFIWQQQAGTYTIELYGPLGIGADKLTGTNNQVTLTTSRGQRYEANTPDALVQKVLNLSLPVSGLRYWLLGQSVPGNIDGATANADGSLQKLNQQGWKIDYLNYETVQGYLVPQKIKLLRDNLMIMIVITHWRFVR